jgi:bifunctional NMN adenylyltransferase/nudix hydrolase
VNGVVNRGGWTDNPPTVALIGHFKDDSSYYLKLFPQWPLIEHDMNEEVNATDLRQLYFDGMNIKYLHTLVTDEVFTNLQAFRQTEEFKLLVEEYEMIKKYKKSWAAAPYAPTFVTVDAVVVQSGHVLLIKRRSSPGKGLTALVGGFVEQNERLEDAMLRELREETRIKVPEPVLRGNIKRSKVYDAPGRSLRGRTVTHAYLIELPPGELPKVKGSDDAEKAMWVPICEIKEENMFEDHFQLINDLLGSLS